MEARIILPNVDASEHCAFRQRIAKHFGGYTATEGFGGWVNADGVLVEECVTVYDIAKTDHADIVQDNIDLANFAIVAKRKLKQDAVYVRFFDGEVEILTA